MNTDYKFLLKSFIDPSILLLPLLERHKDEWKYYQLTKISCIPIEFWEKNLNKLVWKNFRKKGHIPIEFLEKNFKQLYSHTLIENKDIDIEFWERNLFKFEGIFRLDILRDIKLNQAFIQKNIEKFSGFELSTQLTENNGELNLYMNPNPPIELLRKQLDKIYWPSLCFTAPLPEDFLEENLDQVNWYFLSKNKNISYKFWLKHLDKISWKEFSQLPDLNVEELLKYKNQVYWGYIFTYSKVSKEFIQNNPELFNEYYFGLQYNPVFSFSFWLEREELPDVDLEICMKHSGTSLKELEKHGIKDFYYDVSYNENFFINTAKEMLENILNIIL